jgi:5-methyltetrahydropteroyltriglutamate--homocysteine methyltransferase
MQRSIDRILTTHTGSLPRPDDLAELMLARENGQVVDASKLEERVRTAVAETVAQQVQIGIDVVDDGEASKASYSTYVKDRLTGFGGQSERMPNGDAAEFPEWAARSAIERNRASVQMPACDGPVSVKDPQAVHRDIANLKAAIGQTPASDVFMTAVSPGQIARFLPNHYYPSHETYLAALSDAMRSEYRAIVEAGFVLQLDCPDLASGRNNQFADLSLEEFRKIVQLHVEAMNSALDGLPPEQLRMHLCWGNYQGPHIHDVPLADILDIVFTARPSAISFEAANPRHAHEWKLFETVKLPEGKILIPGVIESCSNYVEHPELVAQRIVRYARLVGRENVLAGSDCGFGTFVGSVTVDPRISWVKLAALAEGARLASQELW